MRRRRETTTTVAIPGYEVLDTIGTGGFSVVYRARQTSMNREVAVKVLNSGFSTEAEKRTFERECHALGRLSHHPHIVTVFADAMTTDNRPCIVMELYRSNYRQRIGEGTAIPVGEVLTVGIKIAGALQAAHDQGVLHRDIKPHNIFISHFGEPALGDFGISTLDDERSQSASSGLSLAYAAPEILEDSPALKTSDVYSLASSLYHLVAGTSPFASAELRTTVRRILTEQPAPISRPDAPAGLSRVLMRAMSKDPAERPSSARELAEMLREVQGRSQYDVTPIPIGHDDAGGGYARPPEASGVAPATPAVPIAPGRAGPSAASPAALSSPTAAAPPPSPAAPTGARPAAGERDGAGTAGASALPAMPAVARDAGAPVGVEDRSGSTVARARSRVAAPVEADEEPTDRRRFWIGLAAATGVVVAVAGGGMLIAGGDEDTTESTVAPTPPQNDIFVLPAPADVRVLPNDDGGFNVYFTAADNAERVEIEVTSDVGRGETFAARPDRSPRRIDVGGGAICVVLRSYGEAGRVSDDSRPICST